MCVCVCVCTLSCSVVSKRCHLVDCSPPDSPSSGILQARILERGAISSSRGFFPTQGSMPRLLHWQGGFFNRQATGGTIIRGHRSQWSEHLTCAGLKGVLSGTHFVVRTVIFFLVWSPPHPTEDLLNRGSCYSVAFNQALRGQDLRIL